MSGLQLNSVIALIQQVKFFFITLDILLTSLLGLSGDSLSALGDVCSQIRSSPTYADDEGPFGEWEPIPESWNDDEMTMHAIRDYVDNP